MSEPTTPGTLTYYSLQVQHAENVKWKSKFHRWVRRFYIEVQLGDVVQRSERARKVGTSSNPVVNQYEWNETFPLSAQASGTHVSIRLRHKSSYKSDPCIGYIEGELTELLHDRESVSLRRGPSESSPITASLFFKFQVSDAKLNAKTAFRNLQSSLGDRTHPTRQSLGADAEQTPDQGSKQEPDDVNGDKFQEIRRVVPNIDNIATAVTEVLDINPELEDAWNLTRDLYSVISEHFDTGRVVHLAAKHFTIFEFVRTEERVHDILDGMQDSILRIFDAVSRCCLFIREHARRNPATRRIHRSADTEKIVEIENSLEKLKTELEDAFNSRMISTLNRKPTIRTTALYSLDVKFTLRDPKRPGFFNRASEFYVEAYLSDVPDRARSRSIQEGASEALDHTFSLVSPDPSSLLTVDLIQKKPSRIKSSRVCNHVFMLSELLNHCQTNEGGRELDCSAGHIVLNLKEIDKITSARIELRNTGKDVEKVGSGRLLKVLGFTAVTCGVISSQGSENGDLYASAGKLLLKLDVFAKIAGDIATIHPYLSLAWGVASAVYKAISNQLQADQRVVGLLKQLEAKFDFVRDTSSLRNKTFFLESAIKKLLETTKECCNFIESYFQRPIACRVLSLSDQQKIERHENSLSQLADSFDEGARNYKEALKIQSRLETRLHPSDMNTQGRPSCLEGTQAGIRHQIGSWLSSEQEKPVLWLHGVAGSGKSTIANTIAQELQNGQLGAYLFFERDASAPTKVFNTCEPKPMKVTDKNEPTKAINTMACQLAKVNIVIAKLVEDSILSTTITLSSLFEARVMHPLQSAASYVDRPIIIILDALDECGKPDERKELLDVLAASFSKLPPKFRILITSRPETDIQDVLSGHESVRDAKLDHASQASRDDVSNYFMHEMHELFKRPSIKKQAPTESRLDSNIQHLASAANGLFIWASTAAKYISSRTDIAYKTLEKLVDDVKSKNNHLEFGIDMLYTTILDSVDLAWDDSERKVQVSRVLYLVLTVNIYLSTEDIDAILGLPGGTASIILSRLQSVITYKPDSRSRIRFLHASFSDFLTSERHTNEKWFVDIRSNEEYVNQRCLDSFDIMEESLHFNICGARSSFKANTDEGQLEYSIEDVITPELKDACLSWGPRLRIQPFSSNLHEKLSGFLHNQLLFWLEVLSLIGKVDAASDVLLDAIGWVLGHEASVESFLRDARELTMTFGPAISKSVPHIYLSALTLAPKESKVAKHYSKFISPMIEVDITGERPETSSRKRLIGEGRTYISVSYSPDGRQIAAAGSYGSTVTIWDAEGGDVMAGPMKGHTDVVISVAFSPDGERVVSGSVDKSIRVWDVERADEMLIIEGHTDGVKSVAFSHDRKFIVSGSDDGTVRVWDAKSGRAVYDPMEGHESIVLSVAFSPDDKYIASGSLDGTVRVWDARSGKAMKDAFTGHTDAVNSIAYSPDGKYIVSGSRDETIFVWDAKSGQVVAGPLKGHEKAIRSVAYSPGGRYIVSGSDDETSRVWAVNGGDVVPYSVKKHVMPVYSVGFSPDSKRVASSVKYDGIEIWDIERGDGDSSSFKGHTNVISSVAFLPDNRRVVSGSKDGSVMVWDTKSGKLVLGPLKGHTHWVNSVTCSTDGKFILSGSYDETVRVWNAETGEHVRTLTGDGSYVLCVAVSRDGKRVVAGSSDGNICIWDIESGDLVSTLKGHTSPVYSVCFSPDGKLIASGSSDKTLIVWSAQSGTIVAGPFKGHTDRITTVVFSPDGKRVLSGSLDNTIRVWNVETGQLAIAPLEGQAPVLSISLSPDGKHVTSGSRDGTITVWDAESGGIAQEPLHGHTDDVNTVAYSSDGKNIVSSSKDNTIKVWDAENEVAPSALSDGNAHPNWTLSEDGWILGQGGELLMWAPRDICTALWQPCNTAVLNSRFIARLHFKEHGSGESWEECFDQKAFAEQTENTSK